jgi:AcrR family transcriptional regulator
MPFKGKNKQKVVAEFRRAEILEAARKVFAKMGFEQATVDRIADTAGVAKGTLYLYFPSKREVYLDALRQGIETLQQATVRRMAESKDIAGQIHAFIDTRVRFFEENRDFFRIYHSEFGNLLIHPAHLTKSFRDLYCKQGKMLASVIEKAVKQRTIECDRPELTAFAIYEMTRGLITQRLLGWSQSKVEEDIESLFQLVWKGIRNQ